MKFIFVLSFWFSVFDFMKYLHAQMFRFGWFHFGVVLTKYLSPETKFHFCQNYRNETTHKMSFISRYYYFGGTRFSSFCVLWVFCVMSFEFDVIFTELHDLYIIIVYISAIWSSVIFRILFSLDKNCFYLQNHENH